MPKRPKTKTVVKAAISISGFAGRSIFQKKHCGKNELQQRAIVVGALSEFLALSGFEIREALGFNQCHSVNYNDLRNWRALDWRTRYGFLVLIEQKIIELERHKSR